MMFKEFQWLVLLFVVLTVMFVPLNLYVLQNSKTSSLPGTDWDVSPGISLDRETGKRIKNLLNLIEPFQKVLLNMIDASNSEQAEYIRRIITASQASQAIPDSLDNSRLPLQLKNVKANGDGTADVIFSLNLHELNRIADPKYGHGSDEATNNPPPMNTSFVVNQPDFCEKPIDWLVFIHTSPGNHHRRTDVRSTWGNNQLYRDQRIRFVFMMGLSQDTVINKNAKKETRLYQDIVIGNFIDSYKNLTLKALMGLKWSTLHCQKAKFVVKTDDDAFVDIFELQKLIAGLEKKERSLTCPMWHKNSMPIMRDPDKCMKWCVRFNEFPGRKHFPPYCAGLAYVMSNDLVPLLYKASLTTPFFWIDDVYVTGVLTAEEKVAGVNVHTIMAQLSLNASKVIQSFSDDTQNKVFVLVHVKTRKQMRLLFAKSLQRLSSLQRIDINPLVLKEFDLLSTAL